MMKRRDFVVCRRWRIGDRDHRVIEDSDAPFGNFDAVRSLTGDAPGSAAPR